MKALISSDRGALVAMAADLDADMGFPIDGTDIGGGAHAPPEQSRTLRRVDLRKHPTLDLWALPIDGVDKDARIRPALVAAVKSSSDLTTDWEPTPATAGEVV